MPLPLRDYAQQVLVERGRAGKMHSAVMKAWSVACEKYPERSRWQRKSTFRALVWEAAIREIGTISFDDNDFAVILHRDTASFILEEAILIRFKHADVELATANYPTAEARDFDNHDIDLYGYKGLQRVELVYVTDEYETKIIWIGIAARSNGKFLWKIELNSDGVQAPAEELPLSESETDTSRLAKLKGEEDKDADKKKKNG